MSMQFNRETECWTMDYLWDEGDGFWVTKVGERIAIEDLGDDHLRNILRMMDRNLETARCTKAFQLDLMGASVHGDMASLAIERDVEYLYNGEIEPWEVFPAYKPLSEEAKRRGVEW